MDTEVRVKLLQLLEASLFSIAKENAQQLNKLSDDAVQLASAYDDKFALRLAVLIYASSKLLGRCSFERGVCAGIQKGLLRAKQYLEIGRLSSFERELQKLLKLILSTDKKVPMFVDHILDSAQAKKGVGMHEKGMSIARAAELLGISRWELMKYAGVRRIPDSESLPVNIKDRLNFARRLFS